MGRGLRSRVGYRTRAGNSTSVVPVPTITSLDVSHGTYLGGTSVVFTGTGFTGATSVTFGAVEATSFVVDSATQITATTADGDAISGLCDVTVTTPGGTATGTNLWTYDVAIRNTTTATTSGGTLTLTTPTHQAGDLLVIVTEQSSAGTATDPGGYTLWFSRQNGGGQHSLRVWYKVAGGSEPASVDVTISSNVAGAMFSVAGGQNGNSATATDSGFSTPVSPTVTTTSGGALVGGMLLRFVGCLASDGTQAVAGLTSVANVTNTGRLTIYRTTVGATYANPAGTANWTNSTRWATATTELPPF